MFALDYALHGDMKVGGVVSIGGIVDPNLYPTKSARKDTKVLITRGALAYNSNLDQGVNFFDICVIKMQYVKSIFPQAQLVMVENKDIGMPTTEVLIL